MASEPAAIAFGPLVPMSNLSRFHWARFSFASQQVCHGNSDDGVDTFYDLLLQPELSPYLRGLVNSSVALCATDRTLEDRQRFVDEAKKSHEYFKTYPKTVDYDKHNAFLEDTIADAEEELRRVASEDTDDDSSDDEVDDVAAVVKPEGDSGIVVQNTSKADVSDVESVIGALPVLSHKKPTGTHLPTPAASSEVGNGNGANGNGNGASGQGKIGYDHESSDSSEL